ncbi:MAG: TIGR00296 family protein [Sulfolobales archaeon]|nr:TIGR00296 family protein [Sulfolobales archaeon]MDW8010785.1 TIGR00296 family protein [Sulfolobales archaeon]
MSDYADPALLSLEDGAFLVRLARRAVEEYLKSGRVIEPPSVGGVLQARGMTFTTIRKMSEGRYYLRGCIGYLSPIEPLVNNVITTALAAALEDPRFEPLRDDELDSVIFEVSVLSVSREVRSVGRERAREVVIGRDGLVVEYRVYRGVLLPEVPVEYCWDEETFLSETCIKAGMPPDCWLSDRVKIKKFTARVFKETSPRGDVVELDLSREYREKCRIG